MNKRTVARIFREHNGLYYVCDDSIPALRARGRGYRTKAEALRAAARDSYTHAVGSGTYWAGVRSLKPYL